MTRLTLRGEIDLAVAEPLLEDLLSQVRNKGEASSIEIDCSQLTFIDSSGLHVLVELRERTGRHLRLVGLSRNCRRPFELTGLDQVFELQ